MEAIFKGPLEVLTVLYTLLGNEIAHFNCRSNSYISVMFFAGDGKTHYIKEQLCSSSYSVTIAVNEAFTSLGAIQKLRMLPLTQKGCNVFLNFTMLPPGVSYFVHTRMGFIVLNLLLLCYNELGHCEYPIAELLTEFSMLDGHLITLLKRFFGERSKKFNILHMCN